MWRFSCLISPIAIHFDCQVAATAQLANEEQLVMPSLKDVETKMLDLSPLRVPTPMKGKNLRFFGPCHVQVSKKCRVSFMCCELSFWSCAFSYFTNLFWFDLLQFYSLRRFFFGMVFTSPRLLGTRAALRTLVGMIRQSPMGYSETSPGLDLFTHWNTNRTVGAIVEISADEKLRDSNCNYLLRFAANVLLLFATGWVDNHPL